MPICRPSQRPKKINGNCYQSIEYFGSEELSAHSPAIQELIHKPFIQLTPEDAANLKVSAGDGIVINIENQDCELEVQVK